MYRLKCLAAAIGTLSLAGGCTDLKPHLPDAQVKQLLETWLRDEATIDANRSFEKGQQGSVVVTKTYGYGYSPTESKAELRLTNFRYRELGKDESYTGKGVLDLMRSSSGQWYIHRLAFLDERDSISHEFFAARSPDTSAADSSDVRPLRSTSPKIAESIGFQATHRRPVERFSLFPHRLALRPSRDVLFITRPPG